MKKNLSFVLLLLVALTTAFTSCKDKDPKEPGNKGNEASLTVAPKEIKLFVGSKEQIIAVATPNTNKITYTSSNETVAKVSKEGLVVGIAVGKATITVKSGELQEEVKVEVSPIESLQARMIGTKGEEKAAPFYIPKGQEMKSALDQIKMANSQYGWLYSNELLKVDPDKKGYMFIGMTPDGKDYIDNRTIEIVAYEYNHDIPIIQLYTKIIEENNIFETEEGKKKVKELATQYGFTEQADFVKLGAQTVFMASNTQLGKDETLQITLLDREYRKKGNDKLLHRIMGIISYKNLM